MNKKIVLSLGVALALFSGCGSSSSGDDGGNEVSTGTGYYIDSAVAGVDYKCGSESNVTDKDGKFTFEKGKDCTFSVAGVELRKVEAEKLSDKVKIVEDKPEVAAFLQSIDIDGNVSNGIEIKPEVLTVLKEALKNHTTVPTDDNLTNVVNEVKNSVTEFKGEVVTREKAMEHVKNSQTKVFKELLAGKTLYKPDVHAGKANIVTFKFDSAMSSFVGSKNEAGNTPVTINITVDGNSFLYNYESVNGKYQLSLQADDYIVMDYFDNNVKEDTYRFYYDKSKAEAYMNSLKNGDSSDGGSSSNDHIAITQEMLNGKTFYVSRPDGEDMDYKKMSFSNGIYDYSRITVIKDGSIGSLKTKKYTYSLENGYIKYITDKEVGHIVLKHQDSSTWNVRFQAIDDPSNGTDAVLYLTKPSNFPAEL